MFQKFKNFFRRKPVIRAKTVELSNGQWLGLVYDAGTWDAVDASGHAWTSPAYAYEYARHATEHDAEVAVNLKLNPPRTVRGDIREAMGG